MSEESCSGLEYGLLMTSLDVSVSKHLLDDHYTVIWANSRYYEMFGYTKEEYETDFQNRCDLFFKDDPRAWEDMVGYITRAFAGGSKKYEYVCRMPHSSGKRLWIKLIGNLTDEVIDGYRVSYSVMMDITDQMQLQMEQTVTYNHIPGLIAKYKVTQEGFELLSANQKYFDVFQGRRIFQIGELTEEFGLDALQEAHPVMRNREPICFTFSPVARDGRILHMRVTGTCVDWENGDPVYLLIYDDVTQLAEQQELLKRKNMELELLAYGDSVTGGINRNRFDMDVSEAIRSAPAGTYALVWMNVEKFKLINDLAGNKEGDRTLRYIHGVIKNHLRPNEYLARISSDNFALLLYDEPDQALMKRLEDMTADINRFNENRKYQYILSFTAGIYRVDDPSLEITLIQDRANVARGEIVKNNITGFCSCRVYSEKEREQLVAEKEIENRMRSALEERQFVVYLQPKLSLKEDVISGAEALVRWKDPDKGLIPPNDFIPLFEKNGFIIPLDLYVFEEVCRLLRGWIDRGFDPVPISVNVSRTHFTVLNFMDDYVQICRKYEIPPYLIEIEVTETVVFENPDVFSQIVRMIHKAGFTCSMDDFGSGYSSLNVLKDIEVDTIKLDRAFFASPEMDNPRERDVVTTVIDLAKKLHMEALAEGVETEPQRRFLKASDCDLIQGYVFSRPLPAEDFEKLVFGMAEHS